ncbi:hypothetical protein RN001_004185 [Aquatica leii]|uniref:Aminopeptidase N n=1 Tax=Aquatica leii TaxID=1421715 RepID=A0AAN7PI10_9COLE|nr:hypothetical protein RN001_004185 [Aquatica leii]
MIFVFVYTITLLLVKVCSCQHEDDFLPKTIKPLHYDLTIEPKLKETNYTNFYGSVLIEIEILGDTNFITLHAKKLTINESLITVSDYNKNQKAILNTSFDESKNFFTIHLSGSVKRGEKWNVSFGFFSGLLTDTKKGFYLVKYNDVSNEEKYATVTEFERINARQAFPCFDEPALKATFIVNLIRPNTSTSASNTPIQTSTDLGDGRCKDTFKKTKLMSTYLLAFIISEFKYTEVNNRVRILVRPEFMNYTNYMLSESQNLLRAMENYTGLPYALEKIDLVAIPDTYFLDGAMENWGLIIYAEKYLLCSNTSLLPDLQKCTTFTAHELAHQWFGNLVTPNKWNYIWLSEGFSTFFQYYIADKVEPNWRLMEQYVIEETLKALDNDIVPNTQPITSSFDKHGFNVSPFIYYCKASAIIRMTQHVLSEEIFQNGLQIYLRKNQFNSTDPKNLYNAFEKAVEEANASALLGDKTITEFLELWTTIAGHPIITVTRNYETGTVTFSQVSSSCNCSKIFCRLGFYRVNYDDTNWKRLVDFLHTDKFRVIPPVNRAQLINDVCNFARYRWVSYDIAFNLTTYLVQETDYIPMNSFLAQLDVLQMDLKDNDVFKRYVKKTLKATYDRLGLEEKTNDTHVDKLTRMKTLDWICRYEDVVCQNAGIKILKSQIFTNVSSNLEYPILCGGIQIATMEEWTTLLKIYYATSDIHQKTNYIKALACTKIEKIIIGLLDIIFNIELPITPNDRTAALLSIIEYSDIGLGLEALKLSGRLKHFPIKFYLAKVTEENLSFKFLKWLTFEVLNVTHFRGNSSIEIEVLENTPNVTLHAKDLNIDENSITVKNETGAIIQHRNCTIDEEKDLLIINLNKTLLKNETYNVIFGKFFGTMLKDKYGFFKAEYQTLKNTTAHLVLTEFSPMNARTAFPCFDETALKATFIINLIRPSGKMSASNMPLLKTIDLGNNRYQDVYQETPLMSTYLVAFIISSYKYTSSNGYVRILAPDDYVSDGSLDYILKESNAILAAFEEYTSIPYPLPKLDLVSIPNKYFVDGAMENWGLITYSDTYLHCPNSSSTDKFQVCVTYSAHEFSHQWFGNLVTPKKWNYLWLSEGFGSYFQYHIVDIIKPSWRLKEQFVLEVVHTAMSNDYSEEPIDFTFSEKDDFPNPVIYYQKASSIIRMTSHILTEDVFKEGLRLYLKNNQFKATEPLDLYNSYQEALRTAKKEYLLGNLTIKTILDTWTANLGFPIVTATRDYETGTVTFSQKNPSNCKGSNNVLWHIPISYVFSNKQNYDFNKTTADFWLSKANDTVNSSNSDGWFLVNKQATGYYRVNYDETNWKRIIKFLQSKDFQIIPPINRAQLINDAFYFVNDEALSSELLFNLTTYLVQETDYMPILTFLKNVGELNGNLKKVDDRMMFKTYLKKMLYASYLKLGIENKYTDTHVDRLHRKQVIPLLCAIEEICQNFALSKLRNWKEKSFLSKDFDASLLCGAIKVATLQDWEFLLNQYLSSKEPDLKKSYLHSLTCSKDSLIINRFLDEVFNLNNTMTPEDRSNSISNIGSNSKVGKAAVIEYLLKIKDDRKYKNAFSDDSAVLLELSVKEANVYMPLIKQQIKTIPIIFLNGDSSINNLAQKFLSWYLKYYPGNETTVV